MKITHVLLITLITIAGACNTNIGEVSCKTTLNGEQCFFPSQYSCLEDPLTGHTLLAAAGTLPCNDVLYATCAYSCDLTTGQITLREDRTCPAPPSCNSTQIGCGEACYDANKVCCINSSPVVLQSCPSVTPTQCESNNACNITFSGLGQLADGQLRQNFGAGAFEVSFSLKDGSLYDNHGQICYVTSPENQVQCNFDAQFDTTDDFCVSETEFGQFLAYQDSTQFYACAVGTGGYNIYTTQYNGVYCQPIFIEVDAQICPTELPPTSSSSEDTTSDEEVDTSSDVPADTTSSDEEVDTSSEAPADTTSSDEEVETTSSSAEIVPPSTFPITSSAVPVETVSSSAAYVPPSTFSTTSSAAPVRTTSNVASVRTTSSVAPARTTSSVAPVRTTSSVAPVRTTSSVNTPHASTVPPKNTCVNKPRPVPWCYFDFDLDFDESLTSKSKCSDRSGKGHHGKFFGGPKGSSTHWKLGAQFSGKGQQYISINQTQNLANTFTVATYVKFDTLGRVTVAESSTWSVSVDAKAGKIYFVGKDTLSFDAQFSCGVWIHVAVSIDISGNVVAYKDGKACGQTKKTSCQKHKGTVNVCKHKGSFHGSFDEYFIFNYTLSFTEIESCRNKNKDECATVTAPAQTKTITKTLTKTATKAATPTTKVATPTTKAAPPTTKAAPPTKVAPPATHKKKHNCGVPWVYFPCDQNQHHKCSDESGHGNHGSWFGPTPSQCGGKIRNGVTFSGTTNQAITVPKCPLSSEFSIATWIRFQVSGSASYKLASTKSANGAAAGWELEFNANTKTVYFHGAGNSKTSWDCSDLSANSWFHLSIVVSSSSNCELFVNGNSKGLKSVNKISAGGALWVANSASKNAQLKGSIDEFCLFDRALSAEQVAFARDTYTDQAQTQTNSWAGLDWGAGWEKSSALTTLKNHRIEKWWQL